MRQTKKLPLPKFLRPGMGEDAASRIILFWKEIDLEPGTNFQV